MRQWGATLGCLTLCLVGGCLQHTPETPRRSWEQRLHSQTIARYKNIVRLEVALVETRVADPYLNTEVWQYTDDLVTELDHHQEPIEGDGIRKELLEENGLRVGQVIGPVPSKLQTMLTSDRCSINPRAFYLPVGKEDHLYLGAFRPKCRYEVLEGGELKKFELDHGQYRLAVVASLTEDGKTRLKLTPEVIYGDVKKNIRPAKNRVGWSLVYERPCQKHPDLSWEVDLASGKYLLIGGVFEKEGSFGREAFVHLHPVYPVQRLLVIRTTRHEKPLEEQIGHSESQDFDHSKCLPLAIQATFSSLKR
ncbi:MAG: hypothetical protein ACFCD0_28720 [Gemmataceae bacterium]